MAEAGARYVAALASKDTEALLDAFSADVVFRGMTPSRFWTANSPQQVVDDVLYEWFAPDDLVESIEHVETHTVVDRQRVDYRFRVRNPDGVFCVEQCAYYDLDDQGRVSRMHLMCSGFRAVPEDAAR